MDNNIVMQLDKYQCTYALVRTNVATSQQMYGQMYVCWDIQMYVCMYVCMYGQMRFFIYVSLQFKMTLRNFCHSDEGGIFKIIPDTFPQMPKIELSRTHLYDGIQSQRYYFFFF